METVYDFGDYRSFLKNHVTLMKQANPHWSIGGWARKMDVSSTATITNILNGKRRPGKSLQSKFVDYFKFDTQEESYFLDLVRLDKVMDDPRLSVALMEKLKKKNPYGVFHKLDDDVFDAISKWQYYAIREMVALPDFMECPKWIRARLKYPLTHPEIKETLATLERLELIARDTDGVLRVSHKIIKTTEDVASEGIKRFHEQMIEFGKLSLRETPVELRDISARTLNIKTKDLPLLKQMIREFRDNVSELFEDAKQSDETYQLNVQLFPLTENRPAGEHYEH